MKKLLLFSLTFLFSFSTSYSQHEADKWFFGVMAGLDFFNGPPVALYGGAIYTNEGCATISDVNGSLLFYTDGVTVWNRNHQVMPNGTGLMGGISSTQSSICIPLPGSLTTYYLFTVDEIGGPNGFRYSIVDMTLQGGDGDIDTTAKNVSVLPNVTEKLTAMRKVNGDYHIAVHEWGSDAFFVYQLSSTGLQPFPVISHTGSVHNMSVIQNTYGAMKFSPCGDKIAAAISYQDTVEIFDFNENTGIVSNPITLPIGNHVYGIEYSRTGDFLYVSTYDPLATLVQFDLTSGNAATILASMTALSSTPDIYALQIANDGRIYVSRSFSSYLGVINFPNIQGVACDYQDLGVDLDPQFMGVTSALGLPGFIQSAFRLEVDCTPSGIQTLVNGSNMEISPNPASGHFEILLPLSDKPIALSIYDALGKKVFENNFEVITLLNRKVRLDAVKLNLTEGIFFAEARTAEKVFTEKFVYSE